VLARVHTSPFAHDITYLGKVSRDDKIKLMQRAHLILQTAVEEGWGLTITEAASQGTPAVAYNVAGLRDSIHDGSTGILTNEQPAALSNGIVTLLRDPVRYDRFREAAWQWSRRITFDQSYKDFKAVVGIA
jgi:glycosyltransferase involved in cell wall biosynthesis